MIGPDYDSFPSNVVAALWNLFKLLDSDVVCVMRPLLVTDAIQSIGVFAVEQSPIQGSQELGGSRQSLVSTPTLSTYRINVQVLHKDADQQRGIATHSRMTNLVTATVARNPSLALVLGPLSSTYLGVTESFRRLYLERVLYMSSEMSRTFAYMSVLEYCLETETK